MSELENNLAFPTFGKENLDNAAIFGAQTTDVNPFAPPVAQTPIPVAAAAQQPIPTKAIALQNPVFAPTEPASQNPLELALTEQAKASVTKPTLSLFEKLPVFSYGGATEPLEDASLTFEELRIAKADDSPELTEGKMVTWTVRQPDLRQRNRRLGLLPPRGGVIRALSAVRQPQVD